MLLCQLALSQSPGSLPPAGCRPRPDGAGGPKASESRSGLPLPAGTFSPAWARSSSVSRGWRGPADRSRSVWRSFVPCHRQGDQAVMGKYTRHRAAERPWQLPGGRLCRTQQLLGPPSAFGSALGPHGHICLHAAPINGL